MPSENAELDNRSKSNLAGVEFVCSLHASVCAPKIFLWGKTIHFVTLYNWSELSVFAVQQLQQYDIASLKLITSISVAASFQLIFQVACEKQGVPHLEGYMLFQCVWYLFIQYSGKYKYSISLDSFRVGYHSHLNRCQNLEFWYRFTTVFFFRKIELELRQLSRTIHYQSWDIVSVKTRFVELLYTAN